MARVMIMFIMGLSDMHFLKLREMSTWLQSQMM